LEKDLGLEFCAARDAARLLIFEIMMFFLSFQMLPARTDPGPSSGGRRMRCCAFLGLIQAQLGRKIA
jgi:hypothetical protein